MNRKLILIANSGGEHDSLPGVAVDMRNYQQFFMKPEGGAWEEKEIHPIIDISSKVCLHDYIMMTESFCHVDYWLIVFCGHGRVDFNNDTVLCMSDGSEVKVSEINTWVTNTPCMVIADCCREKEELADTPSLLCESMFSETATQLNARACRTLYNEKLRQLPDGLFCTAYAASIGERAGDNDTLGGVYSYNLLKSADDAKQQLIASGNHVAFFSHIHKAASPKVRQMRNNRQNPVQDGRTNVIPFVVIA